MRSHTFPSLVSRSRTDHIFFYTFLLPRVSEDKDSDGKEKRSKSKDKEKKKEPASMFQINGDKDSKAKKKGDDAFDKCLKTFIRH